MVMESALVVSVLLQVAAAIVAIRLIPITRKRTAWILITIAVVLMAYRRLATLIRMLSGDVAFEPDPPAEFAALLISILMVVGIAKIAPIFLSIARVEKELSKSKQMLEDIAQGITDAVMLLSRDFEILWANKAALQHTGLSMEALIGNYCYKATHQREHPCEPPDNTCPVFELFETGHHQVTEHSHYDKNGNRFFVEVSVYPVKNESEGIVNFVHITKDITMRKREEEEKEKLIIELQEALANIKTLRGLLPICASCKKIRDDKGYWEQIEVYIRNHTEAEFSHSICPVCAKRLYPDIIKD